jgi:hypothetical protein
VLAAALEDLDAEFVLEQRICLLMPGCEVNRLCAVAETLRSWRATSQM